MSSSKKAKFQVASPLSYALFQNLRQIYYSELENGLIKNKKRYKFHVSTQQGITAFPIAEAIWESIINERFTSDIVRMGYNDNLLFEIIEETEKWDLLTKTINYPKFIFNRTFDKSRDYYENIQNIIKIRNNIIHFKFSLFEGPNNAIEVLRKKNITYPMPKNSSCSWQMELSSSECIRFCINTISLLIKELSLIETLEYKNQCKPIDDTGFYKGISDNEVVKIFNEKGIDINSVNDNKFKN